MPRRKKPVIPPPSELLALYNKGASMPSLAKKFRCSPSTIFSRISNHPKYAPTEKSPFSKSQWKYIDKQRDQGLSIQEIAAAYGTYPSKIYYWLRKRPGYAPKGRGRPVGLSPIAQARKDRSVSLRARGWTLQEIADSEGVSRQYIYKLLAERINCQDKYGHSPRKPKTKAELKAMVGVKAT